MRTAWLVATWIAALIAVAVFVPKSCGDDEPAEGPAKRQEERRAALGEPIALEGLQDGVEVEATATGFTDPLPAGRFDEPRRGHRRVGVRLTLENTGEAPYRDAPVNGATLVLAGGRKAEAAIVSGGPCAIEFATDLVLARGESRRGCLAFEVPRGHDARGFEFTTDSGHGPHTGIWEPR
jgi:hypothetical protein